MILQQLSPYNLCTDTFHLCDFNGLYADSFRGMPVQSGTFVMINDEGQANSRKLLEQCSVTLNSEQCRRSKRRTPTSLGVAAARRIAATSLIIFIGALLLVAAGLISIKMGCSFSSIGYAIWAGAFFTALAIIGLAGTRLRHGIETLLIVNTLSLVVGSIGIVFAIAAFIADHNKSKSAEIDEQNHNIRVLVIDAFTLLTIIAENVLAVLQSVAIWQTFSLL